MTRDEGVCGTLMWSGRLNGMPCQRRATVRLTGGLHLPERWVCGVHAPVWRKSGWKVTPVPPETPAREDLDLPTIAQVSGCLSGEQVDAIISGLEEHRDGYRAQANEMQQWAEREKQRAEAAERERDEDCAPFLKDGETPAECLTRNRKDIYALLTLLARETAEVTRLTTALAEVERERDERDNLAREREALAALGGCRCFALDTRHQWVRCPVHHPEPAA